MKEKWKWIKGHKNLHQISTLGRCRRLRIIIRGVKFWNYITQYLGGRKGAEYNNVRLYKNGIAKNYSIHRLVALAFIPNPKNLPEVNHKDLNKQNNKKSNLEWITSSGNMYHYYRTKKQLRKS